MIPDNKAITIKAFSMTSSVAENLVAESTEEPNGSADIITSLQALTSNTPNGPICEDAVINIDQANQRTDKTKQKRGRKKKSPQKPCQLPILPKMFAIQISPQQNVLAPVNTLLSTTLLPSSVKQPMSTTQPSNASVPSNSSSNSVELENNKVTSTTTTSKTKKVSRKKGKTAEESIKLAGKFHYASNDSEPAQFQSKDIVLSGGFPQQNRRRIVHNATEKRRKEKINGWIGKIAKVLFKYNPEQQHKIYILEKAYEFISEQSAKQHENGKSQDAFTQSGSSEASGLPQLVRKIAELENLVDILIRLLIKYKIPAPVNVLTSPYVQSKLGNACSGSAQPSVTVQSNNVACNIENSSQIATDPLITADSNAEAMTSNNLSHSTHNSFGQSLSNICSEGLDPSKSFVLVSKTQEGLPVSSVLNQGRPAGLENVAVNTSTMHRIQVTTNISTINEATSQLVTSSTIPEATLALSGSAAQTNSCASQSLQALFSSASNLESVSSQLNGYKKVEESARGSELVFDQVCSGQAQVSNELAQVNNALAQVNNVQARELVTLPTLPSNLTVSAPGPPMVANNVPFITNKTTQGQEQPVFTNAVGDSSSGLTSLTNSLDNAIAVSSNSSSESSPQVAKPMPNAALPVQDTMSSSIAAKQSSSKSTRTKTSNAPTMKSQMFVMKNMVVPRSKNMNTSALLDKISNSPQVIPPNTSVRVPDSMPVLSNDMTMPINCIPLPPIDYSTEVDRIGNSNTASNAKISGRRSQPQISIALAELAKSQSNKLTELTKPPAANFSNVNVGRDPQEFNRPALNEARPNQQQPQTVRSNNPSVSALQTRHSVTSLLNISNNNNAVDNQALSIENILTRNPSVSKSPFIPGGKATPVASKTQCFNTATQTNSVAKPTHTYAQKSSSNASASRKRANNAAAETLSPSNDAAASSSRGSTQQKRAKRTVTATNQPVPQNTSSGSCFNKSSGLLPNSRNRNAKETEEKAKAHKTQLSTHDKHKSGLSLPRPHSIVSLAKSQQHRAEENSKRNNGLSEFSAESLLRNNPACLPQPSQPILHNSNTNAGQDGVLPTILNIFAPASIGNMVNPAASLGNMNNQQIPQNQVAAHVGNISLPTIQSTFSNFSAEALIGGTVDSQQGLNNDNMLTQHENQNLFTDFSTDTLLAGTECSLSYGIDNIMGRNESSISTSCISPNWLQTGPIIDNSPIRSSFNLGFNIFESNTGPQGHKAATANPGFFVPNKWRPEGNKQDDGSVNMCNQSSMWGPTGFTASQKTPKAAPQKQRQKNMMKIQHGNKRGPSYGDFLLVDSTS